MGWNSVSSTQLAHDPAIKLLEAEGYYLTLLPAHVVVHNVPYVTQAGDVAEGKFIIPVSISGEQMTLADHQMDFMGNFPHTAGGVKMTGVLSDVPVGNEITEGVVINYRFSNKPATGEMLDTCYKKLKHYEAIICSEAQAVNPLATARINKPIDRLEESVFRYADTNASRAGITEQANRFRRQKVGIIGLGGTGAYVLDKVAKTSVSEIHLFDGDKLENHNAFRAPGAASIDELKKHQPKVAYYFAMYDVMRRGIYAHDYYVTADNLAELDGLDFVFVCIDSGPARKLITEYLRAKRIAFIDTGIDVSNRATNNLLEATTRTLVIGPDTPDEAMACLSFGDIDDELYGTNIQIAEMNDLNACQAVIEWKKYSGFYANDKPAAYQTVYYSQDNKMISDAS